MKRFLLFITIVFAGVACTKTINVDITGQLQDNAASMVYLITCNSSGETDTLASAPIDAENRFRIKCGVDQPSPAFLCDDNGTALTMFLTESTPLTMRAAVEGGYVVEGGPINDKYNLIIRQLSDLATQVANIDYTTGTAQEEYESLMAKSQSALSSAITYNLDNIIGVELFINQEARNMTADDMRVRFNQFTPEMQAIPMMRLFSDIITVLERCQVGNTFVDVDVETITGEVVPLSSICGKGKWVLLNFWATWCEPCISEMILLRELHSKYALMGFEVCSVSLDHDPEYVRQFVADNQFLWFNVMNRNSYSEDSSYVSDSYGVQFFPANFLISPDGIIEAHNLHGEDLAHELQHRVGKEEICSYPQMHDNHDVVKEGEK